MIDVVMRQDDGADVLRLAVQLVPDICEDLRTVSRQPGIDNGQPVADDDIAVAIDTVHLVDSRYDLHGLAGAWYGCFRISGLLARDDIWSKMKSSLSFEKYHETGYRAGGGRAGSISRTILRASSGPPLP